MGYNWKDIQKKELEIWEKVGRNADDWNIWWANKFDNYNFLKDYNIKNMIEIGCGPFANNTRIIKDITKCEDITLLDPLLDKYIEKNFSVTDIEAKHLFIPLEEIEDKKYDLVVCINTLDHCFDLKRCVDKLISISNILIIGNDLSNDNDKELTKNDILHPIKPNLPDFENIFNNFESIYKKCLKREEGRNPIAHYSTLLYAGHRR